MARKTAPAGADQRWTLSRGGPSRKGGDNGTLVTPQGGQEGGHHGQGYDHPGHQPGR
jgi:hypothetical protein